MQNRTKELEAKNSNIIELEIQINALREKIEGINSEMYKIKENRVHILRTWYNARIDKSGFLERKLGYVSVSYLPSYDYMVELIHKVLKKQTLNNETYRSEHDLYDNMTYYINNHYPYYVNEVEVNQLVKKYNTRNAKTLIKKLEFENKLKLRKLRLTSLIVGNRGERIHERKRMDKTDKIVQWYNIKVEPFANKVRNYFMNELNKLGIKQSYLRFNAGISEVAKWFKAITKNHTMTLGQLKGHIYKTLKKQYNQIIKGYKNTLEKEVKEKAVQKHELSKMTAKQRKTLQFEKWNKVRTVLNMFSGSIEITEKIDFTNYVPAKELVKVTKVKQVINECGIVETHETRPDGTTTISLYA
ncbi:hypothetical protein LW4_043 [Lactococcus phage LW4]|uniref:Uncharacterized protein n=4 Tax=Teubervirus LW31 TaxID=2845420 RepID=A0A1W6JHV7_9CAUD|nr:hypothetical protein H1N70_gp41 [Lactococcus phage LW31]ARM65643.1 hypothetical protein LW31_041 [Lactococcus phage LW31]ARM65731.1 hypothetical protein LW32_044 [Lactococcus phage LW32]ARM65817.1 hypothetical protein LW33_043 [Lactococcus phage LW33]ARM65903.1 hypothetical protein LW4_043 [Lactococcus phage LW4]